MKTITKDSFEEQAKIGITSLCMIMNEEISHLPLIIKTGISKDFIRDYGIKVQLKEGIYTCFDGRKFELNISSDYITIYQHNEYIIIRDSEYKELIGGIVHCQNFIFAI